MVKKEFESPEELIKELEQLSNSKLYIFRGQPNKEFFLQPSVFRDDGKKKLLEDFPCELDLKWRSSEKIKRIIDIYTSGGWKINEWPISTLFNFTFYMFQYNYKLATYVMKNPDYIDIDTLSYFKQRPSDCWIEDEIFYRVFGEHLMGFIGRVTKDTVLKESEIPNTLTMVDESLPQHYGISTSCLDWTYNPYIALYFALQNIPINATHISIFAYQEIEKNNLIMIKEGNPDKNPRLRTQQGVLISIVPACIFYFFNNRWPTMEDYIYLGEKKFKILRHDIAVNHSKYLSNFLFEKGITENILFPDKSVAYAY